MKAAFETDPQVEPDSSERAAQSVEVVYHVRGEAPLIERRARDIAVEQSVEMPLAAIDDDDVLSNIVGRVLAIRNLRPGLFEVRIALAAATIGGDAGQLLNMVFGNTSIHEDVVLHDVKLPAEIERTFGGPRYGLHGLRRRLNAPARALTCSALKPQGLSPLRLAELAKRFAQGGIDYIKDDHGLADQVYSPFAARLKAITHALASLGPGNRARYVPSLYGDLDSMRAQIAMAAAAGVDTVMIAPMVAGFANFRTLVQDHPSIAFIAHPSMAGAARIAPPLLIGKLFRLLGADAVIFPNHGGRFGYSPETCRRLARAALDDWGGTRPSVPVPAGGMTIKRVPEMLDFYGAGVMLLIGGDLLAAGERLVEATAALVAKVHGFSYA